MNPLRFFVQRCKRWLLPESLALRVFLIYAVSVLVLGLTGFGLLMAKRFSALIDEDQNIVQKMVDLSMPTLSSSAVIGDFDTIQRTLAAMVPDSPLSEAVYEDKLGGSIQSIVPFELHAPGWLLAAVNSRLSEVHHSVRAGGREYGQLTLRFNTTQIANQQWRLTLNMTAFVLLGLGLGLVIMRVMLRRWLGNLDHLQAYEAEVLAGVVNPQADMSADAPLEIKQAIAVINRTAGTLRAQFGQRIDVLMDTLIQHKKAMDEATIVCELSPEGRLTYANDSFIAAVGLPLSILQGRRLQDIGSYDFCAVDDWQPSPQIWHGEVEIHEPLGHSYWHQRSIVPIFDASAQVEKFICIDIDISAQKKSESDLLDQVRRQNLLAELGHQALIDQDFSGLVNKIVEAARSGLQASHSALVVRTPERTEPYLLAGSGWAAEWLDRDMPQVMGGSASGLTRSTFRLLPAMLAENQLNDSHVYSVDSVDSVDSGKYSLTLAVASKDGRHITDSDRSFLANMVNILTVAMEKTRSREQLVHLAQYDNLTGLPNRSLLLDRLQLAVKTAQRQGTRLGLIYLDLDRFKQVNDTLGHPAGDMLLVQAAQRMTSCLRAGDTVARLSGDEFALILPGLEHTSDAELVGRKILAQLSEPFDLNGQEAYVTGSMGAAIYPENGADPATLVRSADRAMYSAKEAGRNDFHFYSDDMNADEAERLEFDMLLRGALARDEFFLLYQPKVDLLDGQICGFEALLRWRHPERGVVSPTEFIPLLEETGTIVHVGEWVLNRVAEQIIRWQADGLRVPRVSVNLSPRQFSAPDLDVQVQAMLAKTGVDPTLLEFEITESSLMRNPAMTASLLERFRSYGLSLSIDDFGTGYSSLSYLKRFPLDTLKIDRTFIRDLSPDSDDAAITWAIISLAHSLKLKVVAEGVETPEQLDMLRDRACDEMQGFYFSTPQSAFDCALMLRDEKCLHWETPLNAPSEGHWRTRQDATQADALVVSTQLSERPVEPPAAVPLTADRYQ